MYTYTQDEGVTMNLRVLLWFEMRGGTSLFFDAIWPNDDLDAASKRVVEAVEGLSFENNTPAGLPPGVDPPRHLKELGEVVNVILEGPHIITRGGKKIMEVVFGPYASVSDIGTITIVMMAALSNVTITT